MAGLFFCLASAEGAGLLFFPVAYSHTQAFTANFILSMQLYSQSCKTAHRALQWRFMRLSPPILKRYQTDTIDYNATCATLERITAPGSPAPIPNTSATSDAVQVSTDAYHASPAGVAPAVCGSLASAAPCAPAEVSASSPVQG